MDKRTHVLWLDEFMFPLLLGEKMYQRYDHQGCYKQNV